MTDLAPLLADIDHTVKTISIGVLALLAVLLLLTRIDKTDR